MPADGVEMSQEQAGFMQGLAKDAEDRHQRRLVKCAEAQVLKGEGNAAFKAQDFTEAIRLYTAAIRLDPGNALLYTNAAQAHLKMGDYEAALERCDVAIRADERCVKAHLRRGIALRSMGDYGDAIKAFKQAKKLAPKDQKKTMDRHIDETEVAQQIGESEAEVDRALEAEAEAEAAAEAKIVELPDDDDAAAAADGNAGDGAADPGARTATQTAAAAAALKAAKGSAFKIIERGASKLALPALQPAEYATTAGQLIHTITNAMHQDLFRLRKGTRLLTVSPACKNYLQDLQLVRSAKTPKKAQKAQLSQAAVLNAACTVATLKLLGVAVRRNEASCRDLFKAGAADVELFHTLIGHGTAVQGAAVATLNAAAGSPFVRRLFAQEASAPLVAAILAIAANAKAAVQVRLQAILAYSLLPAEETFRKRYRADFGTKILPTLLAMLSQNPQLADGALLALTNFCAEDVFRKKMAASDSIDELFAYAKRWATDVRTSADSMAVKLTADALYTLLGLVNNLGLDAAGCAYIQQQPIIDAVIGLLEVATGDVYARAALIVARATSTKSVAERVVALDAIPTMVGLIEAQLGKDGKENVEFLNAAARTAVKLVQLDATARKVVANARCVAAWLKLLANKDERVSGNAALCISECCKDAQVCAELASTTVVADLLNIARKDKSKLTENCAIALARLASGHPDHKARLRQLGGFEVLHSRAPKQ